MANHSLLGLGPPLNYLNPNPQEFSVENKNLYKDEDDEDDKMKAEDVQKQLDAERLEHIAQLQAKDAQHHTERLVGDAHIQIRYI
jgi:hypothetical protein